MKVFDRIKEILFEEEEVTTQEVKKNSEIVKEQYEKPIREEKHIKEEHFAEEKPKFELPKKAKVEERTNDLTDNSKYKSDPTFSFPLTLDDEEKRTPKQNRSYNNYYERPSAPRKEVLSSTTLMKEERKSNTPFKPSPIISPVYGILDKNYKKDDIVNKTVEDTTKKALNYDTIRMKAFSEKKVVELEEEPSKSIDELLIDTISIDEEQINDDNDFDESFILDNEETSSPEDILDSMENDLPSDEITTDDALETDLFNLIDSMYERED